MNHEKTRFTMSDVRFPLTIGFYNESGIRVDATDMELCSGTDGSCPSYGSKEPFNSGHRDAEGQSCRTGR